MDLMDKIDAKLTESKLPFSKKDIEKGLKFISALEAKEIKITDWDGRNNFEIDFPGDGKKWYKLNDAVRSIFFYIQ